MAPPPHLCCLLHTSLSLSHSLLGWFYSFSAFPGIPDILDIYYNPGFSFAASCRGLMSGTPKLPHIAWPQWLCKSRGRRYDFSLPPLSRLQNQNKVDDIAKFRYQLWMKPGTLGPQGHESLYSEDDGKILETV